MKFARFKLYSWLVKSRNTCFYEKVLILLGCPGFDILKNDHDAINARIEFAHKRERFRLYV